MGKQRLGEEEIYLIAEQILLGEKERQSFNYLHEDDLARIDALLHRGFEGLVRSAPPPKAVAGYEARYTIENGKMKKVYRRASVHEMVEHKKEDSDRKTAMLYALTRRLAFRVFPLERIHAENATVRRKVWESVNRTLRPDEFAILLTPYSSQDQQAVFAMLSPKLVEDLRFRIERVGEDDLAFHFDTVAAKYSLAAAQALAEEEEVLPELKQYTLDYLKKLFNDLKVYCQQLPDRFGIPAKVAAFGPSQWTRLAGLTPRRDMLALAHALSDALWSKLTTPLPPAQKVELQESLTRRQGQIDRPLTEFVDTIDSLKRWINSIDNVIQLEREESRRGN